MGVDLVPFKICTYDCVYCQLGRTTRKTVERQEYVSIDAVLVELNQKLAVGSRPDYIGLAGSGEPTLNSGIGRLITALKAMTDIPVAVITNGSLLWSEQVQEELAAAALVLPSLDAGDEQMFERVNRADPAIKFNLMIEGLAAFAARFPGETWLEVLLLAGLTDSPAEVEKIAAAAHQISPTRIQLNTASRPAVEDYAHPVSRERMAALAGLFAGPVDIICDFARDADRADPADASSDAEILALLARRPCSADDIAAGLGLHVLNVLKYLDQLLAAGKIRTISRDAKTYYAPGDPNGTLDS